MHAESCQNLNPRKGKTAGSFYQRVSLFLNLVWISPFAFAENEGIEPAKSAIGWVTTFTINLTLAMMVLVIIYKLLQIQFAQREWREVFNPILIAALVVGAKLAAPALQNVMGY
ncbi:MAG: hypothetical protein H2069_10165 [Legionella sp.]|nr:hypothetical protein [Legionella sp.]